ncbi:hypothetical protein ABTX60_22880 [Streptomyces sp. NPDC126510]|uniref:hypothetical protein n=1 Tax=Streptomyces sp. NPDC126510 TaxID=3155317 RepID=UPI003324084B
MDTLRVILAIALGGIGGILLGRWLGRAHPRISLISIRKGRGETEPVEVPPEIVTATREFVWGKRLAEVSKYGEILRLRSSVQEFVDKIAPTIKETAGDLGNEIRMARSREEKVRVLEKLVSTEMATEIASGLRRLQFSLPTQEHPQGDEHFVETSETTIDGKPAIVVAFPTSERAFKSKGAPTTFGLDRIRPFIAAVKYFDQDALCQCLEYANRSLQQEISQAEALIPKIDGLLESDQFILEVAITNHGDRLAILSPYAALKTSGGRISPLVLRASGIRRDDENVTDLSELSAYISVDPQSVKKYVFVSDPLDGSPLRAAYDSGLLECSVVASRESRRGRMKKVTSPTVAFGAGLSDTLRTDAVTNARGS